MIEGPPVISGKQKLCLFSRSNKKDIVIVLIIWVPHSFKKHVAIHKLESQEAFWWMFPKIFSGLERHRE